MRMRNGQRSFREDRRGVATLELAVVLPVLLGIGLGIFEFGNLLYRYHLIVGGVRDAARYAAGFAQGTRDAEARNIAVRGVPTGGTNRVPWWTTGDVAIAYGAVANGPGSCGADRCYRGGDTIVMVTVSTNVAYGELGFLGYLGVGPVTLTASHQERLYGVR
jgi:Flp pilus assembly protein TadG